jgi:hypothetical protein
LNPSEMRLDTARIRDHLRECLLLKKMEPFPVLKVHHFMQKLEA